MEIIGDFETSVKKALSEIDKEYYKKPGLIVCGSHSPKRFPIEDILFKIHEARERGTPFLGICFGHQLAAVEYARNVLGIKDATSQEWDANGTFVVKKMDALNVGYKNGETYWHNYEVAIETKYPETFITTQYHPEYQSTRENPHPKLIQFLQLCEIAAA